MSPHHGSAHRDDAILYREALTDGVCLAIDALIAMGCDATAEALFSRLFMPVATRGHTTDNSDMDRFEGPLLP